MGDLERGQLVSENTLYALEPVLGWKSGSCRVVLQGGEPSLVEENSRPEGEIDRLSVGGESEGPSYVPGVETSAPPATDPELLAEIAEATKRLAALVEKMVDRDRPSP